MTVTVHSRPCWLQYNRRLAIQFTYCTTKLQYTSLPTAIHLLITIHLCIAIQFFHCTPLYCNTIFSHCTLLQYNSSTLQCIAIQFFHCTPLYCNTIFSHCILLQYNSNSLAHLQYNFPANYTKAAIQFPSYNTISLAIQALLLQYNSLPTRLGHNTISTTQNLLLQYKTKPTTLPRLQYNFPIAIQFQAKETNSQYNLGSSPNRFAHSFFFCFNFFQLLEDIKIHTYIFFLISKNTQINL